MNHTSETQFSILLIDDDPAEKAIITRILKALTSAAFHIDHALKCSAAVTMVQNRTYDLVLIDNRLSERISARFTVPIIKGIIKDAPIAVISNDVSPDYLQDKHALGVDHIVDKADMIAFLKSQLDHLLGGRGHSTPTSQIA